MGIFKKLTFGIIFIIALLMQGVAQKNYHTVFVKGKIISNEAAPLEKAKIQVIENGKKSGNFYSDNNGHYEITLNNGKEIILEFGKDKYVTKKVGINTSEVTDDELKYGLFPINIDISLFENFPGLDASSLVDPIAKLSYSDYEGDFVYDNDYSGQMNIKIDKILVQLKQLKTAAYDKQIAIADDFYKDKKYENAWIIYQKAREILPEKQYPNDQIDNIKSLISKLLSMEEAFYRNIKRADKNYDQKKYKISLDYYKKSLLYKPQEQHPITRIDEIEKMLSSNSELAAIIEKEDVNTDIFSEKADETAFLADTNKRPANNLVAINNNHNVPAKQNANKINSGNEINKTKTQTNPAEEKQLTAYKNTGKINSAGFDTVKVSGGNDKEKMQRLNTLLNQYTEENDVENQGRVRETMALLCYRNGDYDKAVKNFEKASELFDKTGNQAHSAILYETLGNINEHLYRYEAASDWYEKSSSLYGDLAKIPKKSEMLIRQGDMNFAMGHFQEAIDNYLRSLSYDTDYDGAKDVSSTLNSIGVVYYEMGKYDEALNYFQKSEKMSENKGNQKEFSMSLNNIGNVEYEWNDYENALNHYGKSADLKKRLNYRAGLAVTLHNIGNVHKKTGNYSKALDFFRQSSVEGIESGNKDIVYENYLSLSEVYAALKDCNKALEYYMLFSKYKSFITRNTSNEQIAETQSYYREVFDRDRELVLLRTEIQKQKLLSWYESQRRVKEVAFLTDVIKLKKSKIEETEAKIINQRRFIWVTIAGIFLLMMLVFTFWWQRNAKKRANVLLSEQNEEINSQKEEIMAQRDEIYAQNREITGSIKYARRIQNAILPSADLLNQALPDNFVFFKPRDIVSGDFYWVWTTGNKVVVAVADCTGHGVPGAFMSVLGFSLLGQVVNELSAKSEELIASDILDNLRLQIIAALHQTGEIGETRDGMDMTLCIYDKEARKLQFSGANTYLYIYGKEEFRLIKGDRMPVSFFRKRELPFTNHLIELREKEMVYLTTDGITDQFGGPDGKKFRQEAFRNLLVEIYTKPLDIQRDDIDRELTNWMGSFNQVDDILVLGWRVS